MHMIFQLGPMTFAEICREANGAVVMLFASEERSLRRALQGLVRDQTLYLFNPMLAFLAGDDAGYKRLCEAVEANQAPKNDHA
jgi:hypothetical protein